MKLLEKHVFFSAFLSEVFSLNMLVYLVFSYALNIYSVSLLFLLIFIHLFCLVHTKIRKILTYRILLVFLEIVWILFFYPEMEFLVKLTVYLILFFYFFSFLFWYPYHVLSSQDVKKNIDPYFENLPNSFISARLFFVFITGIILCGGYLFSWIIPLENKSALSDELEKNLNTTKTGYTNEVSIKESILERAEGSSKAVLYFYLTKNQEINFDYYFPFLLLKANSLGDFDGESWRPLNIKKNESNKLKPHSQGFDNIGALIVSPGLNEIPFPYTTRNILALQSNDVEIKYQPQLDSWKIDQLKNKKNQAELNFILSSFELKGNDLSDQSKNQYLKIPENININSNAVQEFKKSVHLDQKIKLKEKAFHLNRVFKEGEFKPRVYSEDLSTQSNNINVLDKHPQEIIEEFLLDNKEGFCDLFSTSFALLLRSEGIPSRVVSGFKISELPYAGILSVKDKDAHAWVEAWFEGEGWIPFDPTPALQPSPLNFLGQAQYQLKKMKDLLTAFYLVMYQRLMIDFSFKLPADHLMYVFQFLLKFLFYCALVFSFAIGFYYILRNKFLKTNQESMELLSKEHSKRRKKIISCLGESGFYWLKFYKNVRHIRGGKKEWLLAFEQWCLLDEKLRFGPDGKNKDKIKAHCEKMDEIFNACSSQWKEEILGIQKRKTFHNDMNNIKKIL